MASLKLVPLFLLLQFSLSLSSTLFLPLNKDPSSNNYLTRIFHGSTITTTTTTSLVLDLNSPSVYLDCSSFLNPITTLNCRSIQCTSATPNNCPTSPSSDQQQQPCSLPLPLPSGSHTGELVQSSINFSQDDDVMDSFLFLCSSPGSLAGLPSGSSGVFGLGRTRIGAMSQISHFFDHPKKFSLCLSSESGMLSTRPDQIDGEFSRSMIYTPILETGDSSYTISLKSVKLQNKKLPLEDLTTVKLSTVDPYMKMVTRVYREVVRAFITEAEALHMPRYPPQGGFEICYGVQGTTVVPVIDLVLQSEMVKWRIYGHNSMVKLDDEVMCLGVVDGGPDLEASVVLGGHQLEDNLLEFDFGSSMLGFSSSLLKMQSSCAELSLSSMNKGGGGGEGGGGGGGGVQAM